MTGTAYLEAELSRTIIESQKQKRTNLYVALRNVIQLDNVLLPRVLVRNKTWQVSFKKQSKLSHYQLPRSTCTLTHGISCGYQIHQVNRHLA